MSSPELFLPPLALCGSRRGRVLRFFVLCGKGQLPPRSWLESVVEMGSDIHWENQEHDEAQYASMQSRCTSPTMPQPEESPEQATEAPQGWLKVLPVVGKRLAKVKHCFADPPLASALG